MKPEERYLNQNLTFRKEGSMTSYIPVSDPITPEWLSAVLRQSGVLSQGEVITVERVTTSAFNSQTSRLLLYYSDDASAGVPTRLVLKRNVQEAWGVEAGAEEVKFYTLVASLPAHPSITIPCYAAAYDEESGNSYVLLQDMTKTHVPPLTRDQQISIVEGVPPAVYIEPVVDTLAQLHAFWWEHPLLETEVFDVGYWSRDTERFEQYLQRRTTSWKSFTTHEGDWFPSELRELYEQVLGHLQHYLEPRFRTKTKLTLNHGDAYFANFLCPREPTTGTTYLLDWQSPSFDIGGSDLANLCAAFWTSEQRHEEQREEKILHRYHTVLQARGVSSYCWDDLVTDYKIGLIVWLFIPVQDCHDGASKDYWWPKMQCLVAAFRDWHCEDLLGLKRN
jgi:Ecdysteroid kinase-like family